MFKPMELDDSLYQLKPMNCPFHILIYKNQLRSYREPPRAPGGTGYCFTATSARVSCNGLLRVRGFTQDDAHIFCTPDQVQSEVLGCVDFAMEVLRVFGFAEFSVELSTWDEGSSGKYAGTPEEWKLAEDGLFEALRKRDIEAKVMPDEAAFYGPKIDIKMVDAIGRSWQLSTIQFDFNLPRRFGLEYVGPDGKPHSPVMVHRALWGSVERFFGVLIEHYAGAFSTVARSRASRRPSYHGQPESATPSQWPGTCGPEVCGSRWIRAARRSASRSARLRCRRSPTCWLWESARPSLALSRCGTARREIPARERRLSSLPR